MTNKELLALLVQSSKKEKLSDYAWGKKYGVTPAFIGQTKARVKAGKDFPPKVLMALAASLGVDRIEPKPTEYVIVRRKGRPRIDADLPT